VGATADADGVGADGRIAVLGKPGDEAGPAVPNQLATGIASAMAMATAATASARGISPRGRERGRGSGRAVVCVGTAGGSGTAAGVDGDGRLLVEAPSGKRTVLDAGEVHLEPGGAG